MNWGETREEEKETAKKHAQNIKTLLAYTRMINDTFPQNLDYTVACLNEIAKLQNAIFSCVAYFFVLFYFYYIFSNFVKPFFF